MGGTPGKISGDFDDDGDLDALDIDGLVAAIAFGSVGSRFDVTGDSLVNQSDLTRWIDILFGTLRGDANLDRVVDGSDFGIWNTYKFTATGVWSRGDFNADGVTDGSDFGIWNTNKFQSAPRSAGSGENTPNIPPMFRSIWLEDIGTLPRKTKKTHPK